MPSGSEARNLMKLEQTITDTRQTPRQTEKQDMTFNLQVDGETIARASRKADQDAAGGRYQDQIAAGVSGRLKIHRKGHRVVAQVGHAKVNTKDVGPRAVAVILVSLWNGIGLHHAAAQSSIAIFESEIKVTGSRPGKIRYLALHPQILQVFFTFEQVSHEARDVGDRPG